MGNKNFTPAQIKTENENSELWSDLIPKEKIFLSLQNREVVCKIELEETVDSYNVADNLQL